MTQQEINEKMTQLEIETLIETMAEVEGFDPGPVPDVSADVIKAAYDGCGPERWNGSLKDKLNEATVDFAPAILVHDLEFYLSDGTEEKMHEANVRFHENNKRIFDKKYPFFCLRILRPSYRVSRLKAKGIMLALNTATSDIFTKQAWEAACNAKKEREGI